MKDAKKIGDYVALVHFHKEVTVEIPVKVVAENAAELKAAAEAEAAIKAAADAKAAAAAAAEAVEEAPADEEVAEEEAIKAIKQLIITCCKASLFIMTLSRRLQDFRDLFLITKNKTQ